MLYECHRIIDSGKRLQIQTFLIPFRFSSLLAAFTLFTALPSHAWTYYSGASVGSNGTIYGWGVTDVTLQPMYHMAYVNTTLISPVKHRHAYGTGSAANSVRVDVSLPFDSGDIGVYVVDSYSSGYCYVCNCWLCQNLPTEATVSNATPINFTQSGSTAYSDGRLMFTYTWQSSSGNLLDLSGCVVNELVTYPGGKPYIWPSPPWQYSTANPTILSVSGNLGQGTDVNPTGSFNLPYVANPGFDAWQTFSYSCPVGSGNLTSPIDLHREVDQNGSYYVYKVTKSGISASCTLGVNCFNH